MFDRVLNATIWREKSGKIFSVSLGAIGLKVDFY